MSSDKPWVCLYQKLKEEWMEWWKKLSTERVLQNCGEEGQCPKKGINTYNKLLGPLMQVCGKALKVTVTEGTNSKVIFVNKKSAENFFSRTTTLNDAQEKLKAMFDNVWQALLWSEMRKLQKQLLRDQGTASGTLATYLIHAIAKLHQDLKVVNYQEAVRLIKECQLEGSALRKVLMQDIRLVSGDVIYCILLHSDACRDATINSKDKERATKILAEVNYGVNAMHSINDSKTGDELYNNVSAQLPRASKPSKRTGNNDG